MLITTDLRGNNDPPFLSRIRLIGQLNQLSQLNLLFAKLFLMPQEI